MENQQYTTSLQKEFPDIYRNFFSQYEFILSGYLWFNRFPTGISNMSHFVEIKQKINSKCYVGVQKTTEKGIQIDDILMYDGTGFISYGQEKIDKDYLPAIQHITKTFDLDNAKHGYRISVVSEASRGEWLSFSWAMFALIVTAIGIMKWVYNHKILEDYKYFESSQQFTDIVALTNQCLWLCKVGNPWSWFYTTIIESAHPYVYLSEDMENVTLEDIPHVKKYCNDIPTILQQKEPSFSTLPVRRALVYTGQKGNTVRIENQKKFIKDQNNIYGEAFLKHNRDHIKTHLHGVFSKHNYYDVLVDALDAMSAKTLYLFLQIYTQGPQNYYIKELMDHLNTINSLYSSVENDHDIFDDFAKSCTKNGIATTTFGILPIYSSKNGGNYLFVFEDDSDLQVLENIIQDLKATYPHIRISHLYDFDLPPSQGIMIEQDISVNDIHTTNTDNYILLDNTGNQHFCKYADIDPTQQKGLFLDAHKSKVYLNGKALTSKDIKSQTTTIEIFDLILQSSDYTIKNNQLWPSTFSGQQNQMLGKIVYPLVKLIKAETGKDFPLECTGSLREFWLKLWKTDIPVVLIKKI